MEATQPGGLMEFELDTQPKAGVTRDPSPDTLWRRYGSIPTEALFRKLHDYDDERRRSAEQLAEAAVRLEEANAAIVELQRQIADYREDAMHWRALAAAIHRESLTT